MQTISRFSLAPEAADRNGIAEAQTLVGAGNLTLDGALASGGVATLDVPRHISLYSAGNISAVTFVVTGTDRFGNAITEAITGPNATTVKGAKNFQTVTQIAADGAVGSDVEAGSADEAETAWFPLNHCVRGLTTRVALTTGASLTFGLQMTMDDVQALGFQENDADAFDDASITGESAAAHGHTEGVFTAARIAVTGHTTGGIVGAIGQGL